MKRKTLVIRRVHVQST